MYYYNQMDYPNISYSYKNNEKTIKTSGCGVVSACIVFNNMAGKELYTVPQMAKFSLNNGARDNSGTNMTTLLKALCKSNSGFSFTTTNSEDTLIKHLNNGGMAIANQGDAYNVFSSAGHFVACVQTFSGKIIDVYDPQMYAGKYSAYSRPQRIQMATKFGARVNAAQIGKATSDRSPAYFLISYKKPKTKVLPSFTIGKAYTLTETRGVYKDKYCKERCKVKDLTANGKQFATFKESEKNAYFKKGTKITVQAVFKNTEKHSVIIKCPSGWLSAYNDNTEFLK